MRLWNWPEQTKPNFTCTRSQGKSSIAYIPPSSVNPCSKSSKMYILVGTIILYVFLQKKMGNLRHLSYLTTSTLDAGFTRSPGPLRTRMQAKRAPRCQWSLIWIYSRGCQYLGQLLCSTKSQSPCLGWSNVWRNSTCHSRWWRPGPSSFQSNPNHNNLTLDWHGQPQCQLDYDDRKVEPVTSDCMSSLILFASCLVSNFTHNRCQPPYERAWRSDSHCWDPVRTCGLCNSYLWHWGHHHGQCLQPHWFRWGTWHPNGKHWGLLWHYSFWCHCSTLLFRRTFKNAFFPSDDCFMSSKKLKAEPVPMEVDHEPLFLPSYPNPQ